MEDRLLGAFGILARHRLQRGQADLGGRRVAEADMVELHAQGPIGDGHGIRGIAHERRQVEDLEDPLEAHEGRHDVDADIGQRGEGAVELGEEGDEGKEGPQRDGALDDEVAPHTVGNGGGDRSHQ